MADRKHGLQAPPTTRTIRSREWDAQDLDGESFANVLFVDVDMTELVNLGSTFTDCTFRGVRFNVSSHTDAAFLNCTFTRCSFFDATFKGCKATGSMFDSCTYGLFKVEGGDWSFVGFRGADRRGSAFHNARLRE